MSNRARNERAGRRAEGFAALYLRVKGYHILERRYKTRRGEIDIIAQRGQSLAIIEVKQRATLEAAQAAITRQGQIRIMAAAHIYIGRNKAVQKLGCRYDIIFVIGRRWGLGRILHLPDAWRGY